MKKFLEIGFATIFILLLVVIGINAFDEELNPEVKTILNWEPDAQDFLPNNAYIFLVGFAAKADDTPEVVGLEILNNEFILFKKAQSGSALLDNVSQDRKDYEKKLSLAGLDTKLNCDYKKVADCVAFYQSKTQETQALMEEHKIALDRYEYLSQMPDYSEIIFPSADAYIPQYSYITSQSELKRRMVVVLLEEGHTELAMKILRSNAEFAHRLYRQSKSIISNVIALGMIQKDVRLLSEILHHYPEAYEYSHIYNSLLQAVIPQQKEEALTADAALSHDADAEPEKTPPTFDTLPIAVALEKEFQILTMTIYQTGKHIPWYQKVFYQKNNGANLAYKVLNIYKELLKAKPNDLVNTEKALQQRALNQMGWGIRDLYIKNPIPKFLMKVSQIDYATCIQRAYDTEAIIRMVDFQSSIGNLYIKSKGASKEQKEFFTSEIQRYARFLDPYTQEPFTQTKDRKLSFTAHSAYNNFQDNTFSFSMPE